MKLMDINLGEVYPAILIYINTNSRIIYQIDLMMAALNKNN